jgi:hypothetical protein
MAPPKKDDGVGTDTLLVKTSDLLFMRDNVSYKSPTRKIITFPPTNPSTCKPLIALYLTARPEHPRQRHRQHHHQVALHGRNAIADSRAIVRQRKSTLTRVESIATEDKQTQSRNANQLMRSIVY